MQGLLFSDEQKFENRFAPLLPALEKLWWFVDFQSGPFSSLWIYENEANERRFEQIHFLMPFLNDTSSQVWRPGTLPELAPHIVFDEWSYLVGFESSEDEVLSVVVDRFAGQNSFTGAQFFSAVQGCASIYIIDVAEGWFEIYSPFEEWIEILHNHWPSAQPIDSMKWQ